MGYIRPMNVATLSALAEPNRLRIVELLRANPFPVGEIAERLGMRQPQVSKHLRVLNAAGIVDVQPVAQQRIYYLRPQPFQELDQWLETFHPAWEERLDVLEDFLREVQAKDND